VKSPKSSGTKISSSGFLRSGGTDNFEEAVHILDDIGQRDADQKSQTELFVQTIGITRAIMRTRLANII